MHLECRSTFLLKGGCFGPVVSMPGGMRGKAVLERYSAPLRVNPISSIRTYIATGYANI